MTEHKFTDEEIVKALECCADCDCYNAIAKEDCPFVNIPFCKNYMRKQALDLINRQRAEVAYWMDAAVNAKKEAVGAFAERLKKYYASLNGKTAAGSVEYHIDQIAKEMVGD